ncbi:MAG: helix-turn-helix domain-containing protein [bacterium]
MATKTRATGGCPVHRFQQLVSGKYKLRILWDLQDGPLRYSEIRRTLLQGSLGSPVIPARVLSRELRALTTMGMISRKDYKVVPPKVEYTLTATGESMIPVISVIHKWGTRYL